ncbi:50S ribosomal protein L10 [Candidatus Micrarchaeota archaeon]|nr:50S ribosomal protein L10 [Candidatus Micrarchaeota archaeon]
MREGKVPDWKVKEVEDTKKLIESKPVVGIINLSGMPSSQFQSIKKQLRGKAEITVIKANFLNRAFEKAKDQKLRELEKFIDGPSALIVSNENPFKLFSIIKKNRGKASAKAGMIAEKDFIVPAGETDLPVGPALSELKVAKVDCKIDKGKIVVNKDSIVTKKGEKVTEQAVSALSKLGIMPVEIGLTVKAIYENGLIYTPDVLNIDEEQFMNTLQACYVNALNLSVNVGYPTKQNIVFMIQKAYNNARNLSVNAKIYNKESMPFILSQSAAEMNALKNAMTSKGYSE